MKTNENGIYDARTLGLPKMLILGLQHMFAMFGATILVPVLVNTYFHGEGLSIQVTLFCAGIGTLLFHLMTRFKVPAFLGSSFAFLGGFQTVANLDTGIFANMSYGEKLPYACGGVSGIIPDHQGHWRTPGYAFPSAGCNRPNHHLYRTEPCTFCDLQRLQ